MFEQTVIIGRLGKDPEARFTPTGSQVTTFPVATDRSYPGKDGELVKITTWFRVAAWGKIGENCSKYLAKGKLVMVLGYLNPDPETGGPRVWTGDDGSPRASYEVTAATVRFLSPSDHHAAAEPAELGSAEEIPY